MTNKVRETAEAILEILGGAHIDAIDGIIGESYASELVFVLEVHHDIKATEDQLYFILESMVSDGVIRKSESKDLNGDVVRSLTIYHSQEPKD